MSDPTGLSEFGMAMGIISPFFLLFGVLRMILSSKPKAGYRSLAVGVIMLLIYFVFGPT